MANSLSFDGTDMATYNLVIASPGDNLLNQIVSRVQLQDRGYAFRPQREPRRLSIDFYVTGSTRAVLDSNLDSIKRLLTTLTAKQLIFDSISARYFMAIMETFDGQYRSPFNFRGTMRFVCPDPLSYSTTENTVTQDVDANPKTLYIPSSAAEVVGGSGFVLPTFVLTAGETLSGVTLLLKNETTLEELSISSLTMANTEVLTIDSSLWTVTLEAVAHMSNVTGKFPRLEPQLRNQFTVTAFGTLGTMSVIYRDAYL